MHSIWSRVMAAGAILVVSTATFAADGVTHPLPEPGVLELAGIAAVVGFLVRRISRRK